MIYCNPLFKRYNLPPEFINIVIDCTTGGIFFMEFLMNTFTIPFSLISLNEYINAERTNKFKASKIKKDLTNNIGYFCKKLELENCQYDLVIVWTTKDKRKDTDNVSFAVKFILDAVVKMEKLPSDGYKHIRNISHIREIGTENILVTFNKVQ